jgi:FkbM family methyltransferase
MRKIFLDCGAHEATSVKRFKKEYPGSKEYEIYSFEGMAECKKSFKKYPDVKFKNNLVWIEDGAREFYVNGREGSSVYKDKAERRGSGGKGKLSVKPETVKSIDFDRWIKEEFNKDDYIILKMDIEGAEYEVVEHMIKNGSISYIDKLYIEWHRVKVKEITVERHLDLLESLADLNIVPYHWSHTSKSLDSIATSKRNIVRNEKDIKDFEQYQDRYDRICERFKELHNKNV